MTVTFANTPTITGEGSIRKVDADDPTKGLAGAVIKIEGVDNDFTGTYVTGTGGYLTDVPWKDMPLGSYTAEEVTPPEGYTKSPDVNKTKQTFRWDGKRHSDFNRCHSSADLYCSFAVHFERTEQDSQINTIFLIICRTTAKEKSRRTAVHKSQVCPAAEKKKTAAGQTDFPCLFVPCGGFKRLKPPFFYPPKE